MDKGLVDNKCCCRSQSVVVVAMVQCDMIIWYACTQYLVLIVCCRFYATLICIKKRGVVDNRCCFYTCVTVAVVVTQRSSSSKTSHHLCFWANKVVVILLSSHPVDCCLSWEGNISWIRCARTRVVTSKGGLSRGHEVTSTTEGCDASSAASLCPCLQNGLVRCHHHQTVRQNNRFGRWERCVLFILCDIVDGINFSITATSSIPQANKNVSYQHWILYFTFYN
jgi:hypothetical protein